MIPLARHSTLPELQALVALFRPSTLYPLTIGPDGREYTSMPSLFRDQLPPDAPSRIAREADEFLRAAMQRRRGPMPPSSMVPGLEEGYEIAGVRNHALNVECGKEVEELLQEWAAVPGQGRKRAWEADDVATPRAGEGSPFWGSDETYQSLQPGWTARQPLLSTDRLNQPLPPSPSLKMPAKVSDATSSTPLTTHVTLVPVTETTSGLPPSSPPPSVPLIQHPSARSNDVPTVTRPPAATRERRRALTAAVQRSLRGLLAPGGRVIPFASGDSRLDGRPSLASRANARTQDEESWYGESLRRTEVEWESFRTVAATPERLRRR